MRKIDRLECLGGPLDGKKVVAGDIWLRVRWRDGRPHYYRMCCCSMKVGSGVKYATYYHYIGDRKPRKTITPTLVPHRKLFK